MTPTLNRNFRNLFDCNWPTRLSYSSYPWREDVKNKLPWTKVTQAIMNLKKPFLTKVRRKWGVKPVVIWRLMVSYIGFPESIVFGIQEQEDTWKGKFCYGKTLSMSGELMDVVGKWSNWGRPDANIWWREYFNLGTK